MGLSKPVITTEADISGITSTLAEIKSLAQNSGQKTTYAKVMLDTDGQATELSTNQTKTYCDIQGSGLAGISMLYDGTVTANIEVDGVDITGGYQPGNVWGIGNFQTYYYTPSYMIPFAKSLKIVMKNTASTSKKCAAKGFVMLQE